MVGLMDAIYTDAYRAGLVRLASYWGAADAEDAVQDAYVSLVENEYKVRSPKGYLRALTIRNAGRQQKARGRLQQLEVDTTVEPDQLVRMIAEEGVLAWALANGVSVNRIAAVAGVSPRTVRRRIEE